MNLDAWILTSTKTWVNGYLTIATYYKEETILDWKFSGFWQRSKENKQKSRLFLILFNKKCFCISRSAKQKKKNLDKYFSLIWFYDVDKTFIIKGFRTIVFIFIVTSTTFPLAFFRCLSNSGTFMELRTLLNPWGSSVLIPLAITSTSVKCSCIVTRL